MNNSNKIETSITKCASLTVYDFEGRNIINSAFLIFKRSHAVYLLVVDFNQLLDLLKDDTEERKECIVHDQIVIWLNSIHSCEPSSQPGTPPVILVFTRLEKIPKAQHQEVMNKCFHQICYILNDKPTQLHLVDFIGVDSTQFDPQLKILQKKILKFAPKMPYLEEEISANWFPLEKTLMKLKASGTKVISLRQVEELNQTRYAPREIAEQLDRYLRFQHEKGNILYFSEERLRESIVLDPKWLIDALNSLITARMFILQEYPRLREKWFEFETTGKLKLELIDTIWKRKKNAEFHKNKDHLLLLMDKMNIVIKPLSCIEGGDEIKNFFLVPCELDEKETPKHVICPEPDHQIARSPALCYVFTPKSMSSLVFYKLLAVCIKQWPIATQRNRILIFNGCCVFQLQEYHELTLHFREHVIFVKIAKKGTSVKFPSSELCIKVRKFITDMLNKINECQSQKLNFECFIQCAESKSDTINGLIPVSQLKQNVEVQCGFHGNMNESRKLLEPWFENKQKMDTDGQIYSEIPYLTTPEQRTDLPLDPLRQKRRCSDDQEEYAPKISRLDKQGKLGSTSSTSVMVKQEIEEKREHEAKGKHFELSVKLNENISEDSFNNVKQMARTYLGKKDVEKAKNMLELWNSLETNRVIGVGEYDKLINMLARARVKDQIDIIEETAKEIRAIMQKPHS